ncbi:MAG: hypothetical protein F4018_03425 [Acidobacteria bacterium]|nr:hypothetical protein [Acidobacteriota bacterium]
MNSQPLTPPTEPAPIPAPRPAARARALRRSRRPRPRPTSDPRTLWRRRESTWTTLSWSALEASLPRVASAPFINGQNQPHPFEEVVALEWPASGMLTNAERRDWNRHPVTSTDIEPVDPRELAVALRHTLGESFLGAPKHWDAGCTTLGEWWAFRARYTRGDNKHGAHGPIEIAMTVSHALGSPLIRALGGLRLPESGAEIATGVYYVTLDNGRIRLPNSRDYDLIPTLAHQAQATDALIASWTEEALLHPTLASWAANMGTRAFGHTMAARLVALHDKRRFSSTLPADQRPAPMDTACDVAWTLADHLRSVPDIDVRIEQQNRIIKTVSELCWWNENGPAVNTHTESVH